MKDAAASRGATARSAATGEAAFCLEEGVARFGDGDVRGAIAAWTQAVTLDPMLAEAWFDLGTAYADVSDSSPCMISSSA